MRLVRRLNIYAARKGGINSACASRELKSDKQSRYRHMEHVYCNATIGSQLSRQLAGSQSPGRLARSALADARTSRGMCDNKWRCEANFPQVNNSHNIYYGTYRAFKFYETRSFRTISHQSRPRAKSAYRLRICPLRTSIRIPSNAGVTFSGVSLSSVA